MDRYECPNCRKIFTGKHQCESVFSRMSEQQIEDLLDEHSDCKKHIESLEKENEKYKKALDVAMSAVDCNSDCYGYKCSARCNVTTTENKITAILDSKE